MENNLKIKGNIWIETDTGLEINAAKALLLEQIDVLGSISEGAQYALSPCLGNDTRNEQRLFF